MRKIVILISFGLIISCTRETRFRLLPSSETGVEFSNNLTESDSFNVMTYEYIYNGAGVGVADPNNDGLQDLVFAGNQVSPRAYLNMGNFKFKDITSDFKGMTNDEWYGSVTIGDVNNDGWPDVYLTATTSPDPNKRKNRLWVNQGCKEGGDPTFIEMAEKYGIADTCNSTNAGFLDYDLDGNLDLYILNNTVTQRMMANYREKLTDGSAPNNDRLYHNNGDGTFTNVTIKAGIVYEGYGLGLAIGDVNKDGYPDIYISNDFMSNDLLYINQKDGTFKNEIARYLSYQSKSSMGDDMADINNDGDPDIYTLDMMPEAYYKMRQTINGFSYIFYIKDQTYNYEHQYLRNMLHLHNGFLNGQLIPYSEIGQYAGIFKSDWSWSPLFADYDNDGDKDLIISNGFPKDMTDKDWTKYKTTAQGFYATDKQLMDMAPAVKVPNVAYENDGNLRFEKRNDWLPSEPSFSYGASFVDLDNDGDLDYVVNNINDKAFILRNYTVEKEGDKASYIEIKLVGEGGNTMALGAKIEVWSGGNYQYIEHFLSRGYASSVDPVVHFGLAGAKVIDSLKVVWPNGKYVSVLKNLKTNQIITLNEKDAVPLHVGNTVVKTDMMFNRENNMIDYVHRQKDYVDFSMKQRIIPHKFSQIGPSMAKGDLNGDGLADIIIGSTNELPTTVFLRTGKNFTKASFEGLTTMKDFSEGDLAIVDVDNDGDNDVVAVAGGYENNDDEYRHYVYKSQDGKFIKTLLPVPPFPSTVLRPCDYNKDGFIDLFIGSRVKRNMYPYANNSWIVRNDNGRFAADTTLQFDLGMVTDAVWTDYDKDGWQDLLVVREWNSPIILKNMDGKGFKPVKVPELEDHHGLWYSVTAGDFDNDGDDDYIIGNLGENNRFTISDKYPLNLYVVDLDMDGTIDPVMTAYWPDKDGKMKEYPVNYLDELWSQSIYFRRKIRDYTAFSNASINDIFDQTIMKRMAAKLYVNTASSYIIWNDNGKFNWEKLPVPVQLSPLSHAIVQDLNDDGYPDVILTGNDYTFDVSTGYYDANKGLVLINKGKNRQKGQPSFDLLEPSQSGLMIEGMVESLLYFKGDTSLVVAGVNRAGVQVFDHISK